MRDAEENKRKARETAEFKNMFPTLQDLLSAPSRSNVLSYYRKYKANMYAKRWPIVSDLPTIYSATDAADLFVSRCVWFVFSVKENVAVGNGGGVLQNIIPLFSANNNDCMVEQLLCFISEYPSMRQFGHGFDYTHFAATFDSYKRDWAEERNRLLEEDERRRRKELGKKSGVPTGVDALVMYMQTLLDRGIDARESPLYKSNTGIAGEFKKVADMMMPQDFIPNAEETKKYYELDACPTRNTDNIDDEYPF